MEVENNSSLKSSVFGGAGKSTSLALTLAALRIMTGLLFLEHGMAKIFDYPFDAQSSPLPLTGMIGAAAVLEFGGGILVTLGLFTRVTSFILCGQMAVAYFLYHAPQDFFPIHNHGESSILFCFIFLHLAVAGPGAISVDSLRKRLALKI